MAFGPFNAGSSVDDRPLPASYTLPTAGWIEDANDTSGYPYHYDLSVNGVTADDIAYVIVPYSAQKWAVACGLCPDNETLAGVIRFRAASVPGNAIALTCWLEKQAVTTAS